MNEMFYCRSLNLVSYLLSKGVKPEGYNDKGKNLTFYFKKNDQLQEVIDSYNNNKELKEFIAAFKEVKELIRTNKNK